MKVNVLLPRTHLNVISTRIVPIDLGRDGYIMLWVAIPGIARNGRETAILIVSFYPTKTIVSQTRKGMTKRIVIGEGVAM